MIGPGYVGGDLSGKFFYPPQAYIRFSFQQPDEFVIRAKSGFLEKMTIEICHADIVVTEGVSEGLLYLALAPVKLICQGAQFSFCHNAYQGARIAECKGQVLVISLAVMQRIRFLP